MRRAFAHLRRGGWRSTAPLVLSSSSRAAPPRVIEDPVPPPPERAGLAPEAFRSLGEEIYRVLVTHCRLRPTQRVLDVLCGYAPAARPLSRWLIEGRYDGVDTDPRALAWCRENVSSRFPDCHFRRVRQDGETIRYPLPDRSFHAVVAWDVLGDVRGAETEQHVSEVGRVLRAGRWAAIAFAARDGTEEGEEELRALLARHELDVVLPLERRRRPGRSGRMELLDLVVAQKRRPGGSRPPDSSS